MFFTYSPIDQNSPMIPRGAARISIVVAPGYTLNRVNYVAMTLTCSLLFRRQEPVQDGGGKVSLRSA